MENTATASEPAALGTIVIDERYLQEHDVIQRYIRHELSADELEAFEILLIADPALIEQIESQRLINAVFKAELIARKLQPGFFVEQIQPLLRRALPIAATLVLGLFIGLKVVDHTRPVTVAAQMFTAPTLVLENFRGTGPDNIIDLSALAAGAGANARVNLPLRIDVGPQLAADQRYLLQLREQAGGTVLISADALAAGTDGWLEYPLQLPASVRGTYVLQVSQHDGSEALRYLLNFR